MLIIMIVMAGVLLAYANGANDNFKGVATLFGSHTTSYRQALTWATITTFLGSVAAVFWASTLLKNFSGKGLIEDALVSEPSYAAAVALGAGLTVLLATRFGMPVSTTHSLVGALVGAGLAAGSTINLNQLGGSFFLPLLLSPPLAVLATLLIYPLFRTLRRRLGVHEETCLCVGNQVLETSPLLDHTIALQRAEALSIKIGDRVTCQNQYQGNVLGIQAKPLLDLLHFFSAGTVSFARGLNDTPKIAALLLVIQLFSDTSGVALVGIAIALGGIFSARRVAETMSQKITPMSPSQGFTANLMTSLIVIGASRVGMPVSTTHVSCGALFGLGAVTGQANWKNIAKIFAAWITTLPLGAALGAVAYWALQKI